MRNLFVVIVFVVLLGGCSSAPVEYVEVEPEVVPIIETPHKKDHPKGEDLSKATTHKVTRTMPDGTKVVVEEVEDKVVMTATMAEFEMKMAKIATPKPDPLELLRQRRVEDSDICASTLAPLSCFGNRVSGYNTHYTGGVSYAPQPYLPPPPVERPAGRNTNY